MLLPSSGQAKDAAQTQEKEMENPEPESKKRKTGEFTLYFWDESIFPWFLTLNFMHYRALLKAFCSNPNILYSTSSPAWKVFVSQARQMPKISTEIQQEIQLHLI